MTLHRHQWLVVLCGLCAAPLLRADKLILQNGRELEGTVKQTENEYIITFKSGITTKYSVGDVAKWEKDEAKPAVITTTGPGGVTTVVPAGPAEAPQATVRAAKADPALVLAKSNQSLGLGLKAFQASDLDAAYENFLDSYQVLKNNSVPVDPNNPTHYTLLACLSATCIAKGDFPHASIYLDEATRSKLRDRSIVLNGAIVDFVQHINSLRAVKNLTPMLYTMDDKDIPEHEFEINIYSANVEYLSRDEKNFENPIYKHGMELDLHLRNALQKAHPGKMMWAGRWLPKEEGRALHLRFAAQYAAWKAAIVAAAAAHQAMDDAEANYQNVRSGSLVGKRSASDQAGMESAHGAMLRAQARYNDVKDEPNKLKKAISWPEWPPFIPAKPDVSAAIAMMSTPPPKFPVNRNAVAVPVAPDLVLTSSSVLSGAQEIQVTDSEGATRNGQVVRKDGVLGIALVKVDGKPMRYLNLAAATTAGQFAYWGFPDVPVTKPVPAAVNVSALAPKNSVWAVAVSAARPPRLPGAAVVDKAGTLVGIVLGERVMPSALVPAVPIEQVRAFLGSDAPKAPTAAADVMDVLELRASR